MAFVLGQIIQDLSHLAAAFPAETAVAAGLATGVGEGVAGQSDGAGRFSRYHDRAGAKIVAGLGQTGIVENQIQIFSSKPGSGRTTDLYGFKLLAGAKPAAVFFDHFPQADAKRNFSQAGTGDIAGQGLAFCSPGDRYGPDQHTRKRPD